MKLLPSLSFSFIFISFSQTYINVASSNYESNEKKKISEDDDTPVEVYEKFLNDTESIRPVAVPEQMIKKKTIKLIESSILKKMRKFNLTETESMKIFPIVKEVIDEIGLKPNIIIDRRDEKQIEEEQKRERYQKIGRAFRTFLKVLKNTKEGEI
ncbi:hypothetical protein SNEBB_000542 [Seison nebaliae]|nr:hypothetical protein SNEBB_000542 [Seison nebaliae]